MSQEILISSLSSIEQFEASLMELGNESPYKAYLVSNQLAKVAKRVQDANKEGFQKYYDEQKELPMGFCCKVSEKKTYDYESNLEYKALSEKVKAMEEVLKNATEQSIKGNITLNASGEVIEPVPVKFTEVYTVTRKN